MPVCPNINPCSVEPGYILPLQCRSGTALFAIECEFISTIWIKESDWLTIRKWGDGAGVASEFIQHDKG